MGDPGRPGERGFSLVELTVALLITLIVSGAIYGLIGTGSNAFRREPALTDRQQNIRVAMEAISRDVANAGNNIPAWIQLFAQGLNGAGPEGPTAATDIIQVLGNDGDCPNLNVCHGGGGSSLVTSITIPQCFGLPNTVLLWNATGQTTVMWGCFMGQGETKSCSGNDPNGHVVFPSGQSTLNPSGGPPWIPVGISSIQANRYEIRVDNEGTPNLWRSPYGGQQAGESASGNCDDGVDNNDDAQWRLVARGIEDLQVRYMSHGNYPNTWTDEPPQLATGCTEFSCTDWDGTVTPAMYDNVVRQVEITLGARTVGERALAGETTASNTSMDTRGRTAVRGQLRTVIVPRAALVTLARASPAPLFH